MKYHLTETHEHNFEIHNIVLSSQSISLTSPNNLTIHDGSMLISIYAILYIVLHIYIIILVQFYLNTGTRC